MRSTTCTSPRPALRRTMTALALAGTLSGLAATAASAAPAELLTPHSPVAAASANARTNGHAASKKALLGATTNGIHLHNNSLNPMQLSSATGDNGGMPEAGHWLNPGVGYDDFEVVYRPTKNTYVYAVYDVYNPDRTEKIGTAFVKFKNDEWNGGTVSATFSSFDSANPVKLQVSKNSDGWQIVGTDTAQTTIDAGSAMAGSLVDQYCNTVNTDVSCKFMPSNQKPEYTTRLLVHGYQYDDGTGTAGRVSAGSKYAAGTSTSWSVGVSVEMGLAEVFSAGIEATWGGSVSLENEFSTSASVPVAAGHTAYIWGQIPVTNYTGTLQLKIGTSVFNIVNSSMKVPDSTRPLAGYLMATREGNDPLNSPDTPPADATPVNEG